MNRWQKSLPDLILFAKGIAPDHGGIEVYSDSVAQAWAELGFRVTIISQFEGELGSRERGSVTVVNVGPGSQAAVFWRMLKAALTLRNTLTPQMIHATTWRVAIPALMVFSKVPVTVTVHGREVTQMTGMMLWLMRQVFKRIDKALVISRTTLDQCLPLVPCLAEKAVISWNGLSHFKEAEKQGKTSQNHSESSYRLYSLCRLIARKNIAGVIKALALIRAKGIENWEYLIAGDGDEKARLGELAKGLALNDKVRFLGRVPDSDIASLYRQADIFVHPQTAGRDGRDIEGFGLVIVDAMSFGVPVVAGRDGAPAEYIRDGVTGFLVNGNSVEGIASILSELITNPGIRCQVAENGRTWALKTLTWKQHVERLFVK